MHPDEDSSPASTHRQGQADVSMRNQPVLALRGVSKAIDGRPVLDGIDWAVHPGEHWVVLGPNGCGKTTLIRLASMWLHPSGGSVEVLGERLGSTDVRRLRSRIGLTSAATADMLRPGIEALDVVRTARHGALEPWWHDYCDADDRQALALLDRVGMAGFAHRRFGTLSSGERQRVLLARALWGDPGLILLDEPNAGLDLAGRESLLGVLEDLAGDPATPPLVLVTHHTEEIPAGFSHLLLMRDGEVNASGPIAEILTEARLSAVFGIDIRLEHRHGRWRASAR